MPCPIMPACETRLSLSVRVRWERENGIYEENCTLPSLPHELATLLFDRYAIHVSVIDVCDMGISFEVNATRPCSLVLDNRRGRLSLGETVSLHFSFFREEAARPHLSAFVFLDLIRISD